jgi:hypothetical protein
MQGLGLCSIVLKCQAGVFAEGMAYGLFVGQPLDSLVMRGVSMHLGVCLYNVQLVDCSSRLQEVLERV